MSPFPRLAGVRQETISRIETGKQTVTRRIIGRVAKAAGIDLYLAY